MSETTVTATTGPGGGVAKRTVPVQSIDGRAQITRDWLLERFPLPTNRNIADRSNIDLANATLPTGCTAEWVDAAGEFGGKSLKLSFGTTTPVNGLVILPLLPDFRGNYPKALPRLEWRVMSPNWQNFKRMYLHAGEDATSTKKYLWIAINDSGTKSCYGLLGPYTASVNNRYRTIPVTPYANVTLVGTPAAWGETAREYEVRSIAFNVILNKDGGEVQIPSELYLNRVSSPEWESGAIITQMDGGYELSRGPVFGAFRRRGWPGVVSRLYADQENFIADGYWPEFIAAGWDVCLHAAKLDITAMDGTVTEQVLDKILQDWRRFAVALKVQGPGLRTCSNLTNEAPILADAASVLRRNGILGARGQWSDEEFGIDPRSALTDRAQTGNPYPGGWAPRWGRYNRYYQDSGNGGTESARNTFSGSDTEKLLNRIVAGTDLGWCYIHRVMDAPSAGNVGPQFVRDYIAAIEEQFAKQELVPISATQADMLTYERPGDVYLSYDGAWKSRTTGKVAL